ncbi:MAG TPA: NADH-quinone oxidoreductase subunit C [Anaerolineales bacterium]|jgi:NADH-quinone oxidoreductase subunit C|nr:NADH-quinone oxidoreductase subunit C [Anaerolineales bacterium]
MDTKLEPIVQALQEKFSVSLEEFRNEVHVFVNPEQIVEALTLLRDKYDFELLSAMTAVDYLPQMSPRFHVIYQLTSLAKNLSLQLRVPVNGADPQIPTATGVYEVANWRERELMDMFGIRAVGHPDPRILLLPEDWKGKHPLRKDFPLGYEEVQFTFNFDDINLRKYYAKE